MDKHIFKMLLNVDFTKKNVLIPIFERNECWEVLNNTSDDEGPLSTDDSCQIKYMKRDEKKKELSHRFDLAQSKIQKFDIAIDDISRYISQINEEININISINNKNKHSSMNIQSDLYPGVSHTRKYIEELEERLKSFDIVENEIADSTERVLKEIDCTYDRLVNQVIREINHKRDLMKLEAEVFRKETIAPVKASKKEIKKQILNENRSIVQVKKLLNDPTKQNVTESDVEEIFNSNRNIEGIPVLPQIQESPHVALKSPTDSLLHEVLCKVYDFGSIIRTGPIKIINIEEKPASAFVEWVITDPEYAGGEHTYVLQKANGAVNDPTSDKFETIYRGPETYAFIRDLLVGEPITLRVGIIILESTWSPPRFFKTNIPNYRWSNKNKNYIIENQMARKISDNISTLFSHEPQVDSNQIIEFKFLGASKNENNDEGIALIVDPKDKDDNLQRNGALMISTNGKIFMDGNEKLMQLPQIKLGTKIIFTIMRKKNADLRINIECDDKAVTYDWSVKTPLYFAARFSGDNKWHLMVK
ncbi:hypothetical protein PV327_002306 [Microctonus hyperodae]|nr:hypothetical protein PV327_002306 [Microctonus hyperodae]